MAKPGSAPLRRALEIIEEIDRVLHLSIKGIARLSKSASLIEAVENYERVMGTEVDPVESERRIALARAEAEFAQRELDRGFPILHTHATVALWGILEATVEDVALEFLEADASSLAHPSLSAIRISLAEFEQLERVDRLRFLLAEYMRNSKADWKLGVARFETLLELVRLSGGVEEGLRRDLFEHHQVRNALVHRAGVADRRLVAHCPWLGLSVGSPIVLSHGRYVRYRNAATTYLMELLVRMFVRAGLTRSEAEIRVRKSESPNIEASGESPDPPTQPVGSAGG